MAPDKIFIDEDLIAFHILQTRHEGDVEYIRKDVLREWAKEQASIAEKLNGKGAMLKAWDTLIDKLNCFGKCMGFQF